LVFEQGNSMKAKQLLLAFVGSLTLLGSFARLARANPGDGAQSQAERRALFLRGAQLWPVYCNTCHNARPSSEFSASEWQMIIMHMRTQANLPSEDARAVLEYLKSSR
jgi:mono/diheme cytochrome c family protein